MSAISPGQDATTGALGDRSPSVVALAVPVDARGHVAEGVGFEPTEARRLQRLSRPSHSSALAAFRRARLAVIPRTGYEHVVPSSGATRVNR